MKYIKGHTYNVEYVDNTGNIINEQYTPDKDVNIVNIIKYFKENKPNFLRLKEVKDYKEESKMTESENNRKITNLYDYLEVTNFEDIDITDTHNDLLVAFCLDPENGDSDSYDKFLTLLAKELQIPPMTEDEIRSKNITVLPVNMTKWVEDHFDKLDSIFDVGGESKEEEIAELVEAMEGLISGAATDTAYKQLTENAKITEDEDVEDEFEEIYSDDTDSTEDEDVEVSTDLEGTGEDQTKTAEEVSDVIKDVEDDVDNKQILAVDTANSSIDVLIADENSAIDGYNAFLNQARDTLLPALYEVLEAEINEIIADEQDHINKLTTIKLNFKFNDSPSDESEKPINESVKHIEDLTVGDEITIPYARGPKYTEDKSQWVKGKVISINGDYIDLEVPTTLTVTNRQLSNWMKKNESKLKEDHQLYYDDIQEMSTEERHKLWMKDHDKDFDDDENGNNMFWDWAEEEFPVKELNEAKTKKTEDSYDEGVFYEIEEALRDAGLNPVRFVEEGVLTNNLGWTVTGEDGTRQQLTCDGSYLTENNKCKKVEEDTTQDEENEQKYNDVLDITGIMIDSPQEQEDCEIIKTYIKNHPEKSAEEVAELYKDYLEYGDTTIIVESKCLNESNDFKDLETDIEKEVYNYLMDQGFNPFDLDPDDADINNKLNELIEDFQSDAILNYMEDHEIDLSWECKLNHFKPYGIEINVWKI